jgi:hypothetical protein
MGYSFAREGEADALLKWSEEGGGGQRATGEAEVLLKAEARSCVAITSE